ncbi:MAG: transcriptional regulator, MarR family [Caulobacteraceae bacterium]|jgi:DNA-binding MarR family transcriptional regulator|nr:transcriptional regulator, MarR family [Caulobacteraceae bacterium]
MTDDLDPRVYAATCLCLAVRRAARTLGRRYDGAFASLGVTNGQFSILMALSGGTPLAVGELSAELGLDRTSLAATLKPLERGALVELHPDPNDGRARLVAITGKGRSLLDAAIPRWRAVQAETLQAARLEDSHALRAALAAIG